jgi:hypothetical protein
MLKESLLRLFGLCIVVFVALDAAAGSFGESDCKKSKKAPGLRSNPALLYRKTPIKGRNF